jgi:hypothetical protein
MKTIEDYEPGEILAKHIATISKQRKVEIARQLMQMAAERGGTTTEDCLWYLDSHELEFLIYLVGCTLPIPDSLLANAVVEFLLCNPLSSSQNGR